MGFLYVWIIQAVHLNSAECRQIKKKKTLHRRRPGCLTLQQSNGQVPPLYSQHRKVGVGGRRVPGHQRGLGSSSRPRDAFTLSWPGPATSSMESVALVFQEHHTLFPSVCRVAWCPCWCLEFAHTIYRALFSLFWV